MRTYVASLFCALFVVLCLVAPARADLPTEHETWWRDNEAYRVMYTLYDNSLTRAGQALTEAEYNAMVKENEATIAHGVKADTAAGKAAPLAYAQAYAQCVLRMEEKTVKAEVKQEEKPHPLEGFYRLTGRPGMEGYLAISSDGNDAYMLEVAAWRVDAPESFAWSQAEMTALGDSFSTTGVSRPSDGETDTNKDVQIHITIDKGTATLKTSPAFQKGSYAHFSEGEKVLVRDMVFDGHYRFAAP